MQPAAGVRWDLSALFSSPDDPKVSKTWEDAERRADAFDTKWRGRIKSGELSPEEFGQAIRELEALSQDIGKPVTYAHLRFAADSSDPKAGAFLQAQSEAASQVGVKLMFFDLELQEAPESWVEACLASPALADYRHYILVSRQYKPHTLSEREEVLLEETSNVGGRAWKRLHRELLSNQLYDYTDPQSGSVERLSQEAVLHKLRDENREVRQAAADTLSAGLGGLERTIVFIYNTLLANKKLDDRLRKYENPEDSRHMSNELDKATVDIVMSLCRERSDLVARYYEVKREILGLERLTHIDRYAPLSDAVDKKSWEEAREIVRSSFAEFSPVMAQRSEEFFERNWIDAEMREGKTGGAFCSYLTPDLHPVILMTYQGSLDNVMTLAHELGHGVHSSLSREQSYFNYYGTLPLAELASIFGEMLVFEKIVADASLQDKVSLYGQKLEGIFASVHRQAAMFRFEQRAHQHRRERGELSPDDLSAIWQEEIQSMFGDSLEMGEQHRRWWLYVSHFFNTPFYVYAYSFGELLTMAVYERAKHEGPGFADKYVDVLQRGGSETPHELMARLGVDLRDRSFWEGGFAAIDRMVGDFERFWKEQSSA